MLKCLFAALLIFPMILPAQTVYVRIQKNIQYKNSFWNNWKPVEGKLNDSSQVFQDWFNNPTKVRAVMGQSGTLFDNGPVYRIGVAFLGDTVIREGIYNSGIIAFTLVGLDDSSVYTMSFIGSRDRSDQQATLFKYGTQSASIMTDTNTVRMATFSNLAPKGGKLVFSFQQVKDYNYLNAFQLTGVPKHGAKAHVESDSATINYPNTRVNLNATGSTWAGGDTIVQWMQVAGPNAAIFTSASKYGVNMVVSGLIQGDYKFSLYVSDPIGNLDSASVAVHVNGPKPCPVCPVCPPPVVCPLPRTVTGMTFNPVTGAITFTYSDGKP